MSEPKRYTAAGSGVVRTDPKGDLVLYVDYVRLLAEVKELKSQPDPLTVYLYAAELAKDDINRLKTDNNRLKEAISDSYRAVDEMEKKFKELEAEFELHPMAAENARLKAEVERLTKAGDVLANNIVWVELYRPLVAKWNAAKEGKGQP